MKSKNVFISHHGKDEDHIGKLKALLESKGYQLKNSSIDGTKPNNAKNEEYVKSLLRPRIEWAGTVICLIGNETATREFVDWEVQHAAKEGKNIVGVFLHGASNSDIPESVDLYANSIVCWNSDKIINAIEGKGDFENSDGSPRSTSGSVTRETC